MFFYYTGMRDEYVYDKQHIDLFITQWHIEFVSIKLGLHFSNSFSSSASIHFTCKFVLIKHVFLYRDALRAFDLCHFILICMWFFFLSPIYNCNIILCVHRYR